MKHPIVPFMFLIAFSGALIWQAGDDVQRPVAVPHRARTTMTALALAPAHAAPSPVRTGTVIDAVADPGPTDPWPNTEIVNQLRDVDANAASVRAAIANALPVLGTDQDVQLLVGDMLISHGDPIDGLAWQLLACMHCTLADERIGHECAPQGLCDPNLELIDVFKRDFGEERVAAALVRMEEIKAAIASNASLAPYTAVLDKQFPREVGECVQLRTPTPECPPEEIERQTREAWR